jgi:hypothetical protein
MEAYCVPQLFVFACLLHADLPSRSDHVAGATSEATAAGLAVVLFCSTV